MKYNFSKIPKLMFVVNVDWFFLSHRLPLGIAALNKGYDVYVVASDTGKADLIKKYGFKFIDLPMNSASINPFKEIKTIVFLFKIYIKYKPDLLHHVALKAVVYGSIIAKILKISNINAISGLGYTFIDEKRMRIIRKILLRILKYGFSFKQCKLILQNNDDIKYFINNKIIDENKIVLIKGSGVDTKDFKFTPEPKNEILNIVLPARILKDKGVYEFVNAARLIKEKGYSNCKFILVGSNEVNNPTAIPNIIIEKWISDGLIEWWGHQNDMYSIFSKSNIVILPSYREGLPKALIEAASVGRPIITTNVPGCREVVANNFNGIIVEPYKSEPIVNAVEELIRNNNLRTKMGYNSRKKAEKEFDIKYVVQSTLKLYKDMSKCEK